MSYSFSPALPLQGGEAGLKNAFVLQFVADGAVDKFVDGGFPLLPPQGDCRPEARKEEHCRLHPQVGKRPRTSVRQQRQEQQQQDDISRYKPPHGSSLSNQPSSLRLFYPHFDGILFLIQVQFTNLITKACYPIFPIQTNRGPFMPSDLLQVRLRQGITFTFYEDQL